MKTLKITYWITVSIMLLWFGISPLIVFKDPEVLKVIGHLGYPDYFSFMLTCFKLLGMLAIFIPRIPIRIKEWAYTGFAIDLICACISIFVVDGFVTELLNPLIATVIFCLNFYTYNKIFYKHA